MLSAVFSGVVACACIGASLRRLASATSPTSFAPEILERALTNGAQVATLRECLDARGDLSWERDLLDALAEPNADARDAIVEMQVFEMHWLARRWARVPRVCASISATCGGFFGALTILLTEGPLGDSLTGALDALALGVLGASVSAVVLVRSRGATKDRIAVSERLVAHLRALVGPGDDAAVVERGHGQVDDSQ